MAELPPAPHTTEYDLVRAALAAEYEIISEIGRGGMAIVYRAVERELDREVALKVLPLSMSHDAQIVERFLREARTAARLEHPHVVPVWRVGRAGGFPFMAMKLVNGPTLGEMLHARGPLAPPALRRLLIETASALAHAHASGIVHRDIKPDNILLDPEGRALVTDFGIARATREASLTASGTAIGTPRYMSPEQARAKPVDGRADLYSLGIVAYEALTGRVPFDSPDPVAILLAHVEQPPPEPTLNDAESRALWAVIRRLLQKHPDDRFRDARALLTALGVAADATVHAMPAEPMPTSPDFTPAPGALGRSMRRVAGHPWARIGVVTAVAIGAALAFLPRAGAFGRADCGVATDSTGRWQVNVLPLAPTQPGAWLEVTWDVCGLTAGSAVTTTVVMRSANPRAAGRDARPSRMAFADTMPGEAVRLTRRVRLPAVPPGSYLLTIGVRPSRGPERSDTVPLRLQWGAR